METLKQVGEDIGFLAVFMIFVAAVHAFLGQKATFWLLLLILTGQVMFNIDEINSFLRKLLPGQESIFETKEEAVRAVRPAHEPIARPLTHEEAMRAVRPAH